jgi:hypothetical protein
MTHVLLRKVQHVWTEYVIYKLYDLKLKVPLTKHGFPQQILAAVTRASRQTDTDPKKLTSKILCFVDRAHLGIILVNNQLKRLFPFIYLFIYLFIFSTCFEQPSAHHQESHLYQYIIWYISLCVGDCLV